MNQNSKTFSYEETLNFLSDYIKPISEVSQIGIDMALNRVLAEDILSTLDIPRFDNSAMDGWTLGSSDIQQVPFTLKEVGKAFAGHPYEGEVHRGECVRIMTGGKIPNGADTVVMREVVSQKADEITFLKEVKPGQNVRRQGEDIKKDSTCLARGTLLTAPKINLLATLGIASVKVFRKPKVAFFSTGDELQPIGSPLEEGHIYDSNRYCISAMLKEGGFDTLDLGVVMDDPKQLETTLLKAAKEADAVITSGGVSVGDADFMRELIKTHGDLLDFKCRIKPGSPLAFGKIGRCAYFGLPGNPTAAQVTYYAVVSRALKMLSGQGLQKIHLTSATCLDRLKKRPGYTDFQRGILAFENSEPVVRSAGSQKTGGLTSMIRSNCFIFLPETQDSVEPGDRVFVSPFFGACS